MPQNEIKKIEQLDNPSLLSLPIGIVNSRCHLLAIHASEGALVNERALSAPSLSSALQKLIWNVRLRSAFQSLAFSLEIAQPGWPLHEFREADLAAEEAAESRFKLIPPREPSKQIKHHKEMNGLIPTSVQTLMRSSQSAGHRLSPSEDLFGKYFSFYGLSSQRVWPLQMKFRFLFPRSERLNPPSVISSAVGDDFNQIIRVSRL